MIILRYIISAIIFIYATDLIFHNQIIIACAMIVLGLAILLLED